MKITKTQLKQIIKEELDQVLIKEAQQEIPYYESHENTT